MQIAITPVATSVNPQGYSCARTGISVDKDGAVTYNDPGGCDGTSPNDAEGGTASGAASG